MSHYILHMPRGSVVSWHTVDSRLIIPSNYDDDYLWGFCLVGVYILRRARASVSQHFISSACMFLFSLQVFLIIHYVPLVHQLADIIFNCTADACIATVDEHSQVSDYEHSANY